MQSLTTADTALSIELGRTAVRLYGGAERCEARLKDQVSLAHSRAPRALHNCYQELAIALRLKQFLRSVSKDSLLCRLPSGVQAVLSPRAGRMTSKCSSNCTS